MRRIARHTFHAAVLSLLLLGNTGCAKSPDLQLVGRDDYQVSGSFTPGAVPPQTEWPRGENAQFFLGSWIGDESNTGTFVSGSFLAPANIIVFLSGYPSLGGNRLYLQDIRSNRQLTLIIRKDPGQTWQRYIWELPKDWRGSAVRFVANHSATGLQSWLGLTVPRGITSSAKIEKSLSRASVFLLIILLEGAGFLLPGVALALWLNSRYGFAETQFVCISLVGSGASGYLLFWVYLLSARSGRAISIFVLLASLATIFYAAKISRGLAHSRQLAAFVLLMFLTTTFYTGLGFLYERAEDPVTQAQLRFVHPLPIDNAVPYLFADKLYHSDPVRPFLLGDWKSSDRPPLQTGIALLQFPMWSFKTRGLDYQILGTFLQSMWVVPIWGLVNSLLPDRRVNVTVFAFCLLSGFFLVHTFYVWPKLLAATYFLLALWVLGYSQGKISIATPMNAGIAGAAIGLALLSHGGVVFSVIALGIIVLATRKFPPLRSVLSGILMLSFFLLPWTIYQKFYDPPGDRLLKWHLAGATKLDSRPFLQVLTQAYSIPAASAIVQNKLQNIRTLLGSSPRGILRSAMNRAARAGLIAWYKDGIFFYFFQALGLLNLGFLAFLWARIFPANAGFENLFPPIQRLLILPFVSLGVWCLLMYLPGSTVIHQGSLADVMLFFLTLGVSLATFWPRVAYVLLAVQALVLFPLFAVTDMFAGSQGRGILANGPDMGMECLTILSALGLSVLAWNSAKASSSSWRHTAELATIHSNG